MGFKMKFTQPEKQNPEVAAKDFCSEIRDIKGWLECQTHERENITKARMKLLLLRDKYNCNRGIGFCSRTVQLADRVSRKVLQIVNLNHEDWNNCRRGQHFRYLDVFLVEFEVELYRSRQPRSRRITWCLSELSWGQRHGWCLLYSAYVRM